MQTKLLINGQLVDGEGPAQQVFNPALGRVLVEINEASEAQVDTAVRAADAAFDSWSQTPPKNARCCCSNSLTPSKPMAKSWPNLSRTIAANPIAPH